jgi:hypothetical protein
MASWGFLTNHARALLCIAHDPGTRLRDIAARLDITERSAHAIITDLSAAGYLVKQKDGRRNRYQIQAHLPLPEPASRERTVGDVLALLTGNDRPGIELPPASDANGRRATQAELKTPLMPGRQADGPEAQCLTRALKAPAPHEPVTRLAEQARRSAGRSRRPGGSGGCWRGSAGPRGGWSRPGGNGSGHWPQPSPRERDPYSGRRGWSGRPGLPP